VPQPSFSLKAPHLIQPSVGRWSKSPSLRRNALLLYYKNIKWTCWNVFPLQDTQGSDPTGWWQVTRIAVTAQKKLFFEDLFREQCNIAQLLHKYDQSEYVQSTHNRNVIKRQFNSVAKTVQKIYHCAVCQKSWPTTVHTNKCKNKIIFEKSLLARNYGLYGVNAQRVSWITA